jgi:hypothetical protein
LHPASASINKIGVTNLENAFRVFMVSMSDPRIPVICQRCICCI